MKILQTSSGTGSNEKGAVLVVGLLILLLATLLSVGAMNNANMQEKMAANAQNVNRAFQSSESAIDSNISEFRAANITLLTEAIAQDGAASPVWPSITFSGGDSNISTVVVVKYRGVAATGIGISLNADEGDTSIPPTVYEMHATSATAGSNASANVIQGIQYN
jgi:type IV pilus assembly protein PilX